MIGYVLDKMYPFVKNVAISSVVSIIVALVYIFGGFDN